MLREIRRKLVILRNRSPFPQEVKECLNDLEFREWIYMNMRLSGSSLTPEQMDEILRGGCVMEAAVSDHLMLDRLSELRQFIYQLTDMGVPLSQQIIRDMHAIIMGQDVRAPYRKSSPVLPEYGCIAMPADEIAAAMDELIRFSLRKQEGEHPLEKAVLLHNRLLEIYPFHEENEMVARAVLYYTVAEAGLPLAALKLEAADYHQIFLGYLKHRGSGKLTEFLERAVLDRLELMIRLTGHEI